MVVCDIQIHIGSVYLGKDIQTERDVALKLEVAQDLRQSNLAHEYNVYRALSGLPGIPKVYWHGREGPYHVIILDRLGSTFEKIARTSIETNAVLHMQHKWYLFSLLAFIRLCLLSSKLSILESLHD